MKLGVVVGLEAEARIARHLGHPIAIGGGTAAGAAAACQRLLDDGAEALLSFGLSGGLEVSLRPGTLLIPSRVLTAAGEYATDPALVAWLGGPAAGPVWGGDAVAATAAGKRDLARRSGACAIDLESGAVARAAQAAEVPFAVLRAICDPAERDLPHAALVALDARGRIGMLRVALAALAHLHELPALLGLAADAACARRALVGKVRGVGIGQTFGNKAVKNCPI